MIHIDSLEVRFEVEGDSDREGFARLFREFIDRWAHDAEARRRRQRDAAKDRSLLGDPAEEDAG